MPGERPHRPKGQRGGDAACQQKTGVIYPLPQDSCEVVQEHASRCLNYGLRIERILTWDKHTWEPTRQAKERFTQSTNGRRLLRFTERELRNLVAAYKNRWDAMLQGCEKRGYAVNYLHMQAVSRVIVGLGAESVLETSIRLHRIYGFPLIPGSALKGLARSYAELVDGKNESDPTFAHVFGQSPPNASAGKVIFFDAVPADPNSLQLDLDVMNPHYSQYYQEGDVPPADYLNPVPLFFLTIASESEFFFAVACWDTQIPPEKQKHLAQQAQSWLQAGLQQLGIGAKTAAGYGLWQPATPQEESEDIPQVATEKHKPVTPELLEKVTRTTEKIFAQVVDNSRKPIRVRLFVKGYENEILECGGVGNLEAFPVGTCILVRIANFDQKTQRIKSVSIVGIWKP